MYVNTARRAPSGLSGLGDWSNFDFSGLIKDVAGAYSSVTTAKAQAAQAQAQAQAAQAQAQLVAQENALRQAQAVQGSAASVGGMSMTTLILLGGALFAAFIIMKD